MNSDEWTRKVELFYRAFVRQHEDVNTWIAEMKSVLRSLPFRESFTFGSVEDEYWPIAPENSDALNKRGYLLTEHCGVPCVTVRGFVTTVNMPDELQFREVLDEILKATGHGQFVSIRVVEEFNLDKQAL